MEHILEQEKTIPVVGNYDVVVCGGGPAGVCAAIAAGRAGVKVLLIEALGCLGGTWTSSLMGFLMDVANKSGIVKEIEAELNACGAVEFYTDDRNCFTFDIEAMKLVLENLCNAAGVELLYHTRVVAAVKDASRLDRNVEHSTSNTQHRIKKDSCSDTVINEMSTADSLSTGRILSHVVIESKSGRQAVGGRRFID